jgi:transcription initiation factor IIF auxiliary subunit
MPLKLKNSWQYQGDDWWEWEAFLDDEGSGDLANVKSVTYVLHETFADPLQSVEDPKGGFPLRTAGWGEFRLKAFVHLKDGGKKTLTHDIELEYEPAKGISGSGKA